MSNSIVEWIANNPWLPALIIYLIISVAPRPHPGKYEGVMKFIWSVLDRISLMTAEDLPGVFKLPLAGSPESKKTPLEESKKEGT